MQVLSISIDLTKLDKSKIIEGKKGGKYYNLTVTVFDQKDKFDNDISVTDSQSKEQREAKEAKNYIGNGRTVYNSSNATKKEPTNSYQQPAQPSVTNDSTDGLPF